MSRVGVVGAGYVGLVTAACLAELGHSVRCLEIDPERLSRLRGGILPIHEAGLDTLVRVNTQAGRLAFTESYLEAIGGSDIAFIAVPTPPAVNGEADTSHVFSALRAINEHAPQHLIVVIKSTVPVGTGDLAQEIADETGKAVQVVSNPEFLRQGTAVSDFMDPDRIVVGALSQTAAQQVARLYAALEAPVVIASCCSVELAKYTANALLAARISFMNEISSICEVSEADIVDVARIVGLDKRIGSAFLNAGLGWGGSCFPKDVLALKTYASAVGRHPRILQAVYDVNFAQRQKAADKLISAASRSHDPTVAILGLAFKPDTDDIRGSPALDVARLLVARGIRVQVHDPIAMGNSMAVEPDLLYMPDATLAATGADALLLATEWEEYLHLDWSAIRLVMRRSVIVDGRHALDGQRLRDIGFEYYSFGRAGDGKAREGHPISLFDPSDHETDFRGAAVR